MSSSQFDRENEQYEAEIVTLIDEQDKSLNCYIEHSLEYESLIYRKGR